jgi:hypothetical protein
MSDTEVCLIQALLHRPDFMPVVLYHIDESYLTSDAARYVFDVIAGCYDSGAFDIQLILHKCLRSEIDRMACFLTDVMESLETAGVLAELYAVDLVIEFEQALASLDYERTALSEI